MATPVPPELANAAVEAAASPLGTLGVNWKLLVAQLANFSVVLFVMWKWVYTPLLKAMETRTAKIAKGVSDAEAAAAARAGAEKNADETVVTARREAQRIVEEAQAASERLKREMKEQAQKEIAGLVQEGKNALAGEKEKMLADAKDDLADLVVASTEKVVGDVLDASSRKRLIENAVRKLA